MKPFKLDNEPKISSGFTTPEGYFDTFENTVLSKLPKEKTKVISLFSPKKTWYYAAAAAVVIMISIPVYNNYFVNTEEVEAIALEDYITNHTTITDEDLASLLEKEDLEKMKIELNLQDEELEDILSTNSNLEQYITD